MDENRPCLGCPDKVPACSGWCDKPEYLRWKEKQETIRRNRSRHRTVDGYQADAIRKNRRGR